MLRTMTPSLATLFAQLPSLFPSTRPLTLLPSADAFAPHGARFSGGHAARWFAATDGQADNQPFAQKHSLCSLANAIDALHIADELRGEPEGYWVEPHWIAIASDRAGQHLMIDDHDGRVLHVTHDEDHIRVVAASPEAWLEQLIQQHAKGTVVWDRVYGLMDAAELADIRAAQRALTQRRVVAPKQMAPRLRVGLGVVVTLVLVAVVWIATKG